MTKTIITLAIVLQAAFVGMAKADISEATTQVAIDNQISTEASVDSWGIEFSFGPSYGPRPYGPRPHAVCEARNRRGHFFKARGFNIRDAQRNVLDKCYSYSRTCHITDCYRAF